MAKTPIIVGVTGHRKLEHDVDLVRETFREKLHQYEAEAVVTGMALGFDMLAAEVAVEESIPFIAAIPCRGQTTSWPREQKERWRDLIDKAWKTKIVSPGAFAIWKLFERNRWIVERSNLMLYYWNGLPKGGTYHCVEHAIKEGRPHENIYTICRTK